MTIRKLFEWPLGPFKSLFKTTFPSAFTPTFPSAAAVVLAGCFALIGHGMAANTLTVQGVLIDKECSPNAETRMVSGASPHLEGGMLWAYTHKRSCLLMPACQRSGYGVFTYDTTKFLAFDPAGSQKALALIQSTKKEDDMRVEVTGEMQGNVLKVTSLKLLP